MNKNKQDVERIVKDTGLPEAAQIALLANIAVETGNSFDYQQYQSNNPKLAYGLLQFDPKGKLNDYQKYLKTNDYKDSAQNQINYFMESIYGDAREETGYGNAATLGKLFETGDYKEITQALIDKWFIAGTPHTERRMDEAYGFLLKKQNEANRRTREVSQKPVDLNTTGFESTI